MTESPTLVRDIHDARPEEPHECGGCGGLSRRAVLAGAGAIGAAATLAACGAGSGPAETPTTPGTAEPPGTEPGSDDGTPTDTDPAPTGGIAKVADVPVGGAVAAELDGASVIITQPTVGEFVGLSAVCTHQGCTVTPDGDHLTCPCHGSTFDLAGAATRGPATEPLITFALHVDGEDLVVGQG